MIPNSTGPVEFKTGCVQPTVLRFAAVPRWDERNPVLPESDWVEHDDLADCCPEVEVQQNNNCTNAALAMALGTMFRAAGVADVPRFSWSFQYALHNDGVDRGAMCRDLMADVHSGARGLGLPPASAWPDDRIFKPRGGFPKQVLEAAAKWQVLEVYQCLTFADVMSALSLRFGVYHGFVLGTSYQATGPDGRAPEYDGAFANGHAMFSRGSTKRFGDWRTITPNTWGRGFGDRGVGYWPESYFWGQREMRGQTYVNLDAYAIRAVKRPDTLPVAA